MKKLKTVRLEEETIKWLESRGKFTEEVKNAIRQYRYSKPNNISAINLNKKVRCKHFFEYCIEPNHLPHEIKIEECKNCGLRSIEE